MTPSGEPHGELSSLASARVGDAELRAPLYVDGALDLVSVCRALKDAHQTTALVRDGERLGIFTATDLRDALLRAEPPAATAVRELARFKLLEVASDAPLVEALWMMVQHRVHRLLVRDAGGTVVGLLHQLDLVNFVADHAMLISLQIDDAGSVAELQQAAARIDRMIALLHGDGVRVERITQRVTELNTRLFARLWTLLAPPALVDNSCLLVMGSEGRGEQILKTDQDNALLLRDGFAFDGLQAVTEAFSAALAGFGYPPCPGGIMLSQPLWCQPLAGFRESIRSWIFDADPEGPMRLAIFFDAVAVAGDAALLADARAHLDALTAVSDSYLSRFAAPADQFREPGNWFTRLTQQRDAVPLDLKKLGTFPIVHGVRALSLQQGVRAAGTVARLQALVAAGRVDAVLARDVTDALHFLMGLRLSHQLRQRDSGERPGNEVRPSDLGALEREPLHDALAIVKRFRAFLRQHFKLDSL
jgi:CBS domain-containing protein